MAESEEELKSLLMKVKEESEKAGLKLNIQKAKMMASSPITSWQIDEETMETVSDFILLGTKVTADGDCSHEIKSCLVLGRKAMTSLSSDQFSSLVMFDSLRPHGLQHARPPCPSPTPRVYPNSCQLSWWCHPTISSSVVPFFSCHRSFPESGSFLMSGFFASGGQIIGVSPSASILPINIQEDWFPLGWIGWISLQSKAFSRVFSNTTVQKYRQALTAS